jgi:hypothetical protein
VQYISITAQTLINNVTYGNGWKGMIIFCKGLIDSEKTSEKKWGQGISSTYQATFRSYRAIGCCTLEKPGTGKKAYCGAEVVTKHKLSLERTEISHN